MEKVNKEQLGQRIRELRTAAGHTQDDLAELLEQKRQVVSYYENGTRMPNIEQLMTIAKEYNTTTDYLLGLSGVATADKDLQFVCDYTGLSVQIVNDLNYIKQRSFLKHKTTIIEFLNVLLSNLFHHPFSDVMQLKDEVDLEKEKTPLIIEKINSLIQKINEFDGNFDEWFQFENDLWEEYTATISITNQIDIRKNSYYYSIQNHIIELIKTFLFSDLTTYNNMVNDLENTKNTFCQCMTDKMREASNNE